MVALPGGVEEKTKLGFVVIIVSDSHFGGRLNLLFCVYWKFSVGGRRRHLGKSPLRVRHEVVVINVSSCYDLHFGTYLVRLHEIFHHFLVYVRRNVFRKAQDGVAQRPVPE